MKGTPCLLSVKRKTYINLKLFAYSGSNPNGKLATILISRQKYFRNILTTYKIYCMLVHRYKNSILCRISYSEWWRYIGPMKPRQPLMRKVPT